MYRAEPPGHSRWGSHSAAFYPRSNSASISASVVPSALASLSAWKIEGVPCIRRPCGCGADSLQSPHGYQRSGISFLVLGIYYHETHKTNAKTDRNIRNTTPRKIPNTTGSSLRFGLKVEPKESFASSGRSGS